MDAVLRIAAAAAVLGLAVTPVIEASGIEQPNQHAFAMAILVLAAIVGVYSAVRRQPVYARFTTVAYGSFALGLGLFASARPAWQLLAYVVGLLGMNALLHQVRTFGPILAAVTVEDDVARRTRLVALRSLGVSGAVLALSFGGSLAILPLFSLGFGTRDPIVALVLASGLVVVLLVLAVLPETPRLRPSRR